MLFILKETDKIEVHVVEHRLKNSSNAFAEEAVHIRDTNDNVKDVWLLDYDPETEKSVVFKIHNKNHWVKESGKDAKKIKVAFAVYMKSK